MKSRTAGSAKDASAGVPPSKAMAPTWTRPMYATNSPMPPDMAYWRLRGMAAMINLRTLVTVIRMLIIPQMNTMDSACCHVKPIWSQTVTTKNDAIPSHHEERRHPQPRGEGEGDVGVKGHHESPDDGCDDRGQEHSAPLHA